MADFFALDNNQGREVRCEITTDSDQVPFIVINIETVDGDILEEILIEKKEDADKFLESAKKAHEDFLKQCEEKFRGKWQETYHEWQENRTHDNG